MKIFNVILAVFLISLGGISAQTFIGKINPNPPEAPNAINNNTVNILAVMVEFQEDNDGATFGTGKFGSIYSGENLTSTDIIDPLPHDKAYFQNHLLFAKNYFNRVSDGKVNINYTVFDSIITVSKTMRNYSPLPKSDDLTNVVDFAQEVWTIADSKYSGQINFADYDLFAVFHAGVGRDVSLPGSIGNERDLPSVYLSLNTFQTYLDAGFNGIPANGQDGVITNTMIIPCTESREIDAISGIFLLELSTNGLIAASIGSHLGLPDLFNTETGLSAIGRFGLMDGQSIFTYGGLFPPEPSPWEKMYLGWITPETVQNGESYVSLAAKLAKSAGDTLYLKVPINESEYYLIENRARDTKNDGVTITYSTGSALETMTFEKDTTGFQSFEIDSAKGVIVNVDEYDWAVPGSGILIWHIDEKVIAENLSSNSINNDKTRKGVDLEEADGVQDIGERFFTVFGDEVIGEGTEEDLWYSSNEAKLYQNRFSYNTKPNTNSNDDASSLITIDKFSDISNKMNFRVSNGVGGLSLLSTFSLPDADLTVKPYILNYSSANYGTGIFIFKNKTLYNYSLFGVHRAEYDNFSSVKPAGLYTASNKITAGVSTNKIKILVNGTIVEYDVSIIPSTLPVFTAEDGTELIVGSHEGYIHSLTLDAGNTFTITSSYAVKYFDSPLTQVFKVGDKFGAVSENKFKLGDYPEYVSSEVIKQVVNTVNAVGKDISILLMETEITLLENGSYLRSINLGEFSGITGVAVQQLDPNDPNSLGIVAAKGEKLIAWNFAGSVADNFPVKFTGESFISVPSVIESSNEKFRVIYAVTESGKIFAVNTLSGELLESYPLAIGNEINSNPSVYPDFNKQVYLTAVGTSGKVYTYRERYSSAVAGWNGIYGTNSNSTNVIDAPVSSNTFSFDETRAYNWPNPVYDNETFIRYYVGSDSDVEIKIFDIAGDHVAELTDEAIGGYDNETSWNVSGIQSGVYFAHLKVTGKSGGSATKIIKIAVIK